MPPMWERAVPEPGGDELPAFPPVESSGGDLPPLPGEPEPALPSFPAPGGDELPPLPGAESTDELPPLPGATPDELPPLPEADSSPAELPPLPPLP